MSAGPLIAINVLLLYTILGPMVLLGIYTLFDFLGEQAPAISYSGGSVSKDPALWTLKDLDRLFQ
nr:hypothetical protein [uncultured Desulfobacter sp.]